MAASSGWWTRLKTNVGLEEPEPEPQTLMSQINEATTLNRTQRVYGFAGALVLTIIFYSLASLFFLFPTKFAVLYTLANICAVVSTLFLMGPMKQLQNMMEKGRIFATLIFLVAIALTLFAAIKLHSLILTVVFVVLQFGALVWYCLSYIPFARELATRAFGGLMG